MSHAAWFNKIAPGIGKNMLLKIVWDYGPLASVPIPLLQR